MDDPQVPKPASTYEGKRVFSPNELNQAGEDKEYFNPKDDHHFTVPKDANLHDLKPDLQLKEKSHKLTPILKKD